MHQFLTLQTPRSQRLRQQIAVLIVPVANPDGAKRKRRHNAAGQDLNRDWRRGRSREVSAVRDLLARWRPHLVVDVHQWVPGDATQTPMVQASGGQLGRRGAVRMALAARATGLRLVYRTAGRGGSLCHGYWAARGIPAILLETVHRAHSSRHRQIAIIDRCIDSLIFYERATAPQALPQLDYLIKAQCKKLTFQCNDQ